MLMIAGSITIATASTALALSTHGSIDSRSKVLSLVARNSVTNAAGSGNASMGISTMADASPTVGWFMLPGEATPPINFRDMGGSVEASNIYFDHDTSDREIDFIAVLEG